MSMSEIRLNGNPGPLLRELRHSRGLTLRGLESASGYDFAVISRVERGVHKTTYPMLRDLFEALGYEIVLREREDG